MTRSPLRARAAAGGLLLVCLTLAGCGSLNHTADLATNDVFYVDVPFRTRAPGDRTVFVTPLRDARNPATLPLHDQGFPLQYGEDSFWERPIPEMVGEVLQRQLGDSELFPAVSNRAAPDTLVLRPTLVAFTTGAKTELSGSRSFAEVGLRIEVLGPAGQGGRRDVIYDQLFADRQVSDAGLRPISPYLLVGRALRSTMAKALQGLDGSNVGRSSVPMDLSSPFGDAPAASEATSVRR